MAIVSAAGIYSNDDPDAIVAAASTGEEWALTELFRAFQPGLLRYLRSREPVAADDLAGEVWLAVARQLPHFVGDERQFRCWLFTIAHNRLNDHRRRAARRRTDPMPPEGFHACIDPRRAGGAGDPAASVVEQLCSQDAVDLLVGGLPPVQADVVLLRVVAGLDVVEVARILNRSPGSVRVLQHRALRRLATRPKTAVVTE